MGIHKRNKQQRYFKKLTSIFVLLIFAFNIIFTTPINVFAKTTDNEGNWYAKYYYGWSNKWTGTIKEIVNQSINSDSNKKSSSSIGTISEADYVVRVGDIDNFGLGWKWSEKNFFGSNFGEINPFSGKSTTGHYWGSPTDNKDTFDWENINGNEPSGLDRIITVSSYDGTYSNRDDYVKVKNKIDKKQIYASEIEFYKIFEQRDIYKSNHLKISIDCNGIPEEYKNHENKYVLKIPAYYFDNSSSITLNRYSMNYIDNHEEDGVKVFELPKYITNTLKNNPKLTIDIYYRNYINNVHNINYDLNSINLIVDYWRNTTPKDKEGTIYINHSIKDIISQSGNKEFEVKAAKLQMFVDDFQPEAGGSSKAKATYQVKFIDDDNSETRIEELEELINHLNQSGPIGKLITFEVPSKYLDILRNNNNLKIIIDDLETGAGDGYAIDFVKLLINPKDLIHEGTIDGTITDKSTGRPIEKAYVEVNGKWRTFTDSNGHYTIGNVTSGLTSIKAYKAGEYEKQIFTRDVFDNKLTTVNFQLEPIRVNDLIEVDKVVTKEESEDLNEEFEVTLKIKNKGFLDIYEINNDKIYDNFRVQDEIADEFVIVPNSFSAKINRNNNLIDKSNEFILENDGNELLWNFDEIGSIGETLELKYRIKRKNLEIPGGKYPTSKTPAALTCYKDGEGKLEIQFPQKEVDLEIKDLIKLNRSIKGNTDIFYKDEEFEVEYTITPQPIPVNKINKQNKKEIVLVIDTSGSMNGVRIENIKEIASGFVDKFKDDDKVNITLIKYDNFAVIPFSDKYIDHISDELGVSKNNLYYKYEKYTSRNKNWGRENRKDEGAYFTVQNNHIITDGNQRNFQYFWMREDNTIYIKRGSNYEAVSEERISDIINNINVNEKIDAVKEMIGQLSIDQSFTFAKTNIGDALRRAYHTLNKKDVDNDKYIVLMTDGIACSETVNDNGHNKLDDGIGNYIHHDSQDPQGEGLAYAKEVASIIEQSDIKTFVVGFGNGSDSEKNKQIADSAGGVYKDAQNKSEISDIYNDIQKIIAANVSGEVNFQETMPSSEYIEVVTKEDGEHLEGNNAEWLSVNGNVIEGTLNNIHYTLEGEYYVAEPIKFSIKFRGKESCTLKSSIVNYTVNKKNGINSDEKEFDDLFIDIYEVVGKAITGVKREFPSSLLVSSEYDLVYNFDGEEVQYTREKPVEIVLILNTSMTMKDHISELKYAAKSFIDSLPKDKNIKVGAVRYYHKGEIISELIDIRNDDERKVIKNKIDGINNINGTNLGDGIRLAYQLLNNDSEADKHLIIMSDGYANVGTIKYNRTYSGKWQDAPYVSSLDSSSNELIKEEQGYDFFPLKDNNTDFRSDYKDKDKDGDGIKDRFNIGHKYVVTIAEKINKADLKINSHVIHFERISGDGSNEGAMANNNEVAEALGVTKEVKPGQKFYLVENAENLKIAFNTIGGAIEDSLSFNKIEFDETFPKGIEIKDYPSGLIKEVTEDGNIRLYGNLDNIKMKKNKDGNYKVDGEFKITVKFNTPGQYKFNKGKIKYIAPFDDKEMTAFVNDGVVNVVRELAVKTVSITSNNSKNTSFAKEGDIVTLTFETNKDVSRPEVTIFDKAVDSITKVNGSDNKWVATYTMKADDREEKIKFNINLHDKYLDNSIQVSSTTDSSYVIYDNTPPTANIDYSITTPTNENVTAALVPSEDIVITNNDGARRHTFTENGEFPFYFEDQAGNLGSVTAVVDWIDKTPPTAQVQYSDVINGKITAALIPSEDIIPIDSQGITVDDQGRLTHVFTGPGEFTFKFKDLAGNEGQALVKVNKTANIIDSGIFVNGKINNFGKDYINIVRGFNTRLGVSFESFDNNLNIQLNVENAANIIGFKLYKIEGEKLILIDSNNYNSIINSSRNEVDITLNNQGISSSKYLLEYSVKSNALPDTVFNSRIILNDSKESTVKLKVVDMPILE